MVERPSSDSMRRLSVAPELKPRLVRAVLGVLLATSVMVVTTQAHSRGVVVSVGPFALFVLSTSLVAVLGLLTAKRAMAVIQQINSPLPMGTKRAKFAKFLRRIADLLVAFVFAAGVLFAVYVLFNSLAGKDDFQYAVPFLGVSVGQMWYFGWYFPFLILLIAVPSSVPASVEAQQSDFFEHGLDGNVYPHRRPILKIFEDTASETVEQITNPGDRGAEALKQKIGMTREPQSSDASVHESAEFGASSPSEIPGQFTPPSTNESARVFDDSDEDEGRPPSSWVSSAGVGAGAFSGLLRNRGL